jgi:hypothetical protein
MAETTINSDKFKEFLTKYFDGNEDRISNILQECNAIISGGSILSAHYGTSVTDIDIYVNLSNAQQLYTSLTNLELNCKPVYLANSIVPPYDASFMAKNHIIGRQQLIFENVNVDETEIYIDFMIVDDDTPITDVPKNFDLSFCMNWYDGKHLIYMYPDHVNEKRGFLADDYFTALLKGNNFTLKRMTKYTNKNYIISYPTKIQEKSKVFTLNEKKVISPDIWVTTMLIRYILINASDERYSTNIRKSSKLITFLYSLRRIQLDVGNDSLFNYKNFVTMFTDIYTDKIIKVTEDENSIPYNWDIPTLLNIIICSNNFGIGVCNYEDKYQKYIEEVTGAILHGQTRGVTGTIESIPMCDGERPPFSRGLNDIGVDANISNYIKYARKQIINLDKNDLDILFRRIYPKLALKMFQDNMRITTARMALLYNNEDEDEDEDEDTDDYIIPGTDRTVPPRCFNVLEGGDINTASWYPTKDNILFSIEFYPGYKPQIICTSRDELTRSMSNEATIMYECTGNSGYIAGTNTLVTLDELEDGQNIDIPINNVDLSTAYIPFTYGIDGNTVINGYLREWEVKLILEETNSGNVTKMYDLVFVDTISHTASKFNTSEGIEGPNYVSTNHCQAGSSIITYKVVEFDI